MASYCKDGYCAQAFLLQLLVKCHLGLGRSEKFSNYKTISGHLVFTVAVLFQLT